MIKNEEDKNRALMMIRILTTDTLTKITHLCEIGGLFFNN